MLGVVVNKKTQAKAIGRNKIKRRVREFFRTRQGEIRPDLALLIKAREGSAMPGKEDVEADLGELFVKTGALL
ncbi:MAG: ribonuclease P [Candidatus Omnitrophica bacterium ADurb.Bin277]|nr:MAG: ribonuclease P [Candidatus Omnitrophica bacterium ADurb.Bin277]